MIGNMVPSVHTDRHSCCLPLPVVLKSLPMLGRCAPADAWPARAELTSSCNRITSKSLATGFATRLCPALLDLERAGAAKWGLGYQKTKLIVTRDSDCS